MSSKNSSSTPDPTRRSFMRAGSAAAAGLGAHAAFARRETLALNGGQKAVTFPKSAEAALTRWPRYGDAEKKALHELIDSGKFYEELPAFEREWQQYTGSPFVKAHMNGSSARGLRRSDEPVVDGTSEEGLRRRP